MTAIKALDCDETVTIKESYPSRVSDRYEDPLLRNSQIIASLIRGFNQLYIS